MTPEEYEDDPMMNDSNSPINMKELLEIMDDDQALLRECLDDFISDYPDMLHKIQSTIDQGHCAGLEQAAHAFKGTLAYLAAHSASEAAYQLEFMGKTGDLTQARDVFSILKEECLKIQDFISTY